MFEEMFRPLRQYADFKGRAGRPEFWLFMLFCAVATAAAGLFGPLFAGLVGLLLRCPQLAVAVRRLHDVNRPGSDLVVPYAMLAASPLVMLFRGMLMNLIVLGYAGLTMLMFALLLLQLVKKGSSIPNKYGASPSAFSFAK